MEKGGQKTYTKEVLGKLYRAGMKGQETLQRLENENLLRRTPLLPCAPLVLCVVVSRLVLRCFRAPEISFRLLISLVQ